MATVYILHSDSIDKYYIGSCENLEQRIKEHLQGDFEKSFTKRAKDWKLYLKIEDLGYQQSRAIEQHIKNMKSKVYIENLAKYPELRNKLVLRYK